MQKLFSCCLSKTIRVLKVAPGKELGLTIPDKQKYEEIFGTFAFPRINEHFTYVDTAPPHFQDLVLKIDYSLLRDIYIYMYFYNRGIG